MTVSRVAIALGLAPSPAHVDGIVHPDFVGVVEALRWQLATYPGGAAVCVYQRGECVADLWGGMRDEIGRPWLRETMAPSFSTTKGVASTLVHVLVDRGLIDYDAPVAAYWPEFAQHGKSAITVRHVLAHQSGLYHIRQMVDRAERMLDWQHMIRAIESATPIHPPGMRTGYHGLTYGFLVGELAQRVGGKPFPDLVRQYIAKPLGLDGLYVGAPREELPRAAKLIWPQRGLQRLLETGLVRIGGRELGDYIDAPARLLQRGLDAVGVQLDLPSILDALAPRGIAAFDFGADATLQVAIPAANGLFTARALARMYAALAGGGMLDGVRLLSPETLARATQVQASTSSRVVIPFDMRWRLGYHGVFTTRGVPRRAFGHFGFGGSGGWADPSRELAVALIVNSGMGTPFGDLRIARIGAAALAGAARRRDAPATAASVPVADCQSASDAGLARLRARS
ncbi:MAG TPA: serine hydrolase domain-containing protein [Candidatus Eisenbacteria bacterium]|nr:serine hydrolase domain-containing protein [Candidatus Eisenbacteria bacterium]